MAILSRRTLLYVIPGLISGVVAGLAVGVHLGRTRGLPFVVNEWIWTIGIYTGDSPFVLGSAPEAANPVLTAADVTDVPAMYVADPFVVREADEWYMFFEVAVAPKERGVIALATSADGFNWTYEQVVLNESFHLSYPHVFRWEDRYYMVPESAEVNQVRLYEAMDFPTEWRFVGTMLGGNFEDPTLVRHDDRWWLFSQTNAFHNDTLRVFYADELLGTWTEHPQSPVVAGDEDIARPGGRMLALDGRLYRFGQDCSPLYGNQLRAFEITRLTTTEYAEVLVPDQTMPAASGTGWNEYGMHQIDLQRLEDGRWWACVDGRAEVSRFDLSE